MAAKKNNVSPIVLPNGKVGTLPPRKRARTQEEKEQRRIERIIRNRRAAHASREKKRRHVEQLEEYAKKLENCLADFSAVQERFVLAQKQLVAKLDAAGVSYPGVDLDFEPVVALERPDDLDLDTSSHPVKRQKSTPVTAVRATGRKQSASEESIDNELSSPEFESMDEDHNDRLMADDEDLGESALLEELELKQAYKHKLQAEQQPVPKQQDAVAESATQDGILSPPPSTSPSKFRLNDDEVIKQEYSNLFDDDLLATSSVEQHSNGASADSNPSAIDNSLKLFEENVTGGVSNGACNDSLYDQNQSLFRTDDLDYLNCLNDVHHSAVMMCSPA